MTIGERIKQIRKENHLTQVDFAAKLKIGGTSVSKLEKGENNPSDQTITLICREFGVSEEWLRAGEGEMYASTNADAIDSVLDKYALPRELRGLFLGYLGLSDNAKAELRGMLLQWATDATQSAPRQPEATEATQSTPHQPETTIEESVASNKRLSADEIADRVEAYRRLLSGEPPETPEERYERHKREARAEADEYYAEVLQEKIAADEREVSSGSVGEHIA